jgi:hypothetical protein
MESGDLTLLHEREAMDDHSARQTSDAAWVVPDSVEKSERRPCIFLFYDLFLFWFGLMIGHLEKKL